MMKVMILKNLSAYWTLFEFKELVNTLSHRYYRLYRMAHQQLLKW